MFFLLFKDAERKKEERTGREREKKMVLGLVPAVAFPIVRVWAVGTSVEFEFAVFIYNQTNLICFSVTSC